MKVLISGAGIAGLSLAFWLSRLGHHVTVVERSPSLRTNGLQIDLRGHAITVLRRMGLEAAFRELAAPEEGLQVVGWGSGRRWAWFPANNQPSAEKEKKGSGKQKAEIQGFTSDYEIMRGDLCRLFYNATLENEQNNAPPVEYIFGDSIKSFNAETGHHQTRNGSGVRIHFTSGPPRVFGLVVGADGQGSFVREQLFRDEGPGLIPLDTTADMAYFTMPLPLPPPATASGLAHTNNNNNTQTNNTTAITDTTIIPRFGSLDGYHATVSLAPHGRTVMTRRHSPAAIQVYLGCPPRLLRDVRRGDVAREKDAFRAHYRDRGGPEAMVLRGLETTRDWYCERLGVVKLERWSREMGLAGDEGDKGGGMVVLLGDAAYAPSVLTGMGTSSAVVGAYVLAGEIGRLCCRGGGGGEGRRELSGGEGGKEKEEEKREMGGADGKTQLAKALAAYEARMRPFMAQVQGGLPEEKPIWGSTDSWLMNTAVGITLVNLFMGLFSLLGVNLARWMVQEEAVKNWELPEYEEMMRSGGEGEEAAK